MASLHKMSLLDKMASLHNFKMAAFDEIKMTSLHEFERPASGAIGPEGYGFGWLCRSRASGGFSAALRGSGTTTPQDSL